MLRNIFDLMGPKRKLIFTNLEKDSSPPGKNPNIKTCCLSNFFKVYIVVFKLYKYARDCKQTTKPWLSGRRGRQNTMKARLFFAFYAFLCATFLFNICSCATVPKETALKLKDFHAEETKAFGNNALTGESDNRVKGDNNDGDEDEGEWAEEEENEGEEDFEDFDEETEEEFANDGDDEDVNKENEDSDDDEDDEWTEKEGEDYVDENEDEGDHGVDDEHTGGENNEYDDDEDRLMDEEYAIEDEEDGDVPKQLSNVSEDDDDSPEEPAITEKTLELANADRKGT